MLPPINEGVIVSVAPGITEDQSTEWVSLLIGTMRVELSPSIIGSQINLTLVDETGDLNVVRSLEILNTLQCTSGNYTSSVSLLGAPRNLSSFGIGDQRVGSSRGP
ncbi:hypothetical protein AG1IA_08725 [Rhizoctonia solani AG-1 IA]|uniref:Uncharacterized protein n=1 Tax=Thanatephorus cucumeris (strain AG1-IA) TaxID=983506 RepID=L8WKH2_THACA|nr:hypothetical protein AG1IA_08725 [Rhizoctonia solani AG-1 IA]